MKLEKGIEILDTYQELLLNAKEPYLRDALKLGAEAITFFRDIRLGLEPDPHHPLPTETEQ